MNRPRLIMSALRRVLRLASVLLSILLLLGLASAQVHRDVGHGLHGASSDDVQGHARRFVIERPEDCALCSLSEGMNPLLSSPPSLAAAIALTFLLLIMLAFADAQIRRIDHGWNSRAPPGTALRPA